MKLTTTIKADDGFYVTVRATVSVTTRQLTRDESKTEQRKLNNRLFNALREHGFSCQDIRLK